MDTTLKLEELAQFALAAVLLYYQPLHFSWWVWIILFLLPDLGMIGYTVSPAAGAITYNLFHHKMIAILLLGIGYYADLPYFTLAGLLLYGHASFDRALGYGLKYADAFKHTHMGWIGS